jgi:hypothetical protein
LNTHETPDCDTEEESKFNHTGTQMSQLIANSRPMASQAKVVQLKRLTTNANKILYPIREQKLLFKRPGKDGQFGKLKITLKVEDMLAQRVEK